MRIPGMKFLFSVGLLGVICLMRPGLLRAENTVYTYTGNPYTFCAGITCDGTTPLLDFSFITTLTGSQLDNLSNADLAGTVLAFSINDGVLVDFNQSASPILLQVVLSTDSNGNPTQWTAGALVPTGGGYFAYGCTSSPDGCFPGAGDVSGLGVDAELLIGGDNSGDPGTWKVSTVTPEPSGQVLLPIGLLGLLALAARGQRRAPLASC